MALMRHSDRWLTARIYTDENLLGPWSVFDKLSTYSESLTNSLPYFSLKRAKRVIICRNWWRGQIDTPLENVRESHVLTLPAASGHSAVSEYCTGLRETTSWFCAIHGRCIASIAAGIKSNAAE